MFLIIQQNLLLFLSPNVRGYELYRLESSIPPPKKIETEQKAEQCSKKYINFAYNE